jgi:hypothetical protein
MLFVAMLFESGTVFRTVMQIFRPYMYVNAGYNGLEFNDAYYRYTRVGLLDVEYFYIQTGISSSIITRAQFPAIIAVFLPTLSH